MTSYLIGLDAERERTGDFDHACTATGGGAVRVASVSNISLFDKIANPGAADNESGTGLWSKKISNYFNYLVQSQLAQQ
jgi:hypothetical protein